MIKRGDKASIIIEMDGLRIIDNNTGNKWVIRSTGRGQFHLSRIYSSGKNKRRQQSELVFSESECQRHISNGNWSSIV